MQRTVASGTDYCEIRQPGGSHAVREGQPMMAFDHGSHGHVVADGHVHSACLADQRTMLGKHGSLLAPDNARVPLSTLVSSLQERALHRLRLLGRVSAARPV